jgi:integrase
MRYPRTITYYSLGAKIYKGADGYHATWTAGGKRVKRQFKSGSEAEKAAKAALKKIHAGQVTLATLSKKDMARIASGLDLLSSNGYTNLFDVATEYVAAKNVANGGELFDAARLWADNHRGIEKNGFKEAAEDWYAAFNGRWSVSYRDSVRKRMNKLIHMIQVDMCDLDFEVVKLLFSEGLSSQSPKSRNHFREIIRRVIAHSVDRNWIREKHGLGRLLKNERVITRAPDIITPKEFQDMLSASDDELMPMLAIQGFCGARQAEVLRLSWEDVWRRDGYLELNANQTKQKKRRLVPLCDAAQAWLKPYRRCSGPIWSYTSSTYNRFFAEVKKLVDVKGKNILRHSYASYRLGQLQDVAKVSYEMGTHTADTLYEHYRELVTPRQGKQWFSVLPKTAAGKKIIMAS